MTDLSRQFEPTNAAIAVLARRLDDMEDRLPDDVILSCGLHVTKLQAQLDRIETALKIANRLIILPDGDALPNRWAAFSDDELNGLRYVLEVTILGGVGEVDLRDMAGELKAEIERRKA